MIRKNWTKKNYFKMTPQEALAKDTLLALRNILMRFRNKMISPMEAKLEILELQEEDSWDSFEAAMNELNEKDFLQVIKLIEVKG